MDIQSQLNRNYLNTAIYTSGFYADPTNELDTHDKLYDALKSFTMNQATDTPFSLQIMLTNGEINVMPLGLIDLNELKEYESKQRAERGLDYESDQIPLVVRFAPHEENHQVEKEIIGTTQDLFNDFSSSFQAIWAVIKGYLTTNHQLLLGVEADLMADFDDVQKEYLANFQRMSAEERETNLGMRLADDELDHFSTFMAEMHAVQAIVMSAANFTRQEIIGDDLFAQALNDNVRRSTFFWALDNTFYQIFYFFLQRYGQENDKLTKHLIHQKSRLIVQMREAAFKRAQQAEQNPTTAVNCEELFSDLFIPVAEQIAAICEPKSQA